MALWVERWNSIEKVIARIRSSMSTKVILSGSLIPASQNDVESGGYQGSLAVDFDTESAETRVKPNRPAGEGNGFLIYFRCP